MTKGKRVHLNGYNPVYINSPSSSFITSTISAETADNEKRLDYKSTDNKQEMASSL